MIRSITDADRHSLVACGIPVGHFGCVVRIAMCNDILSRRYVTLSAKQLALSIPNTISF